jgi:DeoR/GlpR family transcriptional regulator of sugar metabolism
LEQTQHSNRADVHVVTNSLTVAAELAGAPHVAITVLGGTLHAAELCLVGPETLIALSHYRLDRVFVACAGIDIERGLAAANPFEAEVKRAMLRGASTRVVVADSSKLGHTALVQVAGLDSLDILITNSMAAPHIVADIRAAGVQVELV